MCAWKREMAIGKSKSKKIRAIQFKSVIKYEQFFSTAGFLSFVCLLSWIGKTLQNFLLPQIEIYRGIFILKIFNWFVVQMVSTTSFTFLLDVLKLPIQDEMDFIHAKRHRSRGTKGPPWKDFCLRLGLHCARFHESGIFCWHQIFLSCSRTVAWISSDCYWLEVKTTRSNRMKFGWNSGPGVHANPPRWGLKIGCKCPPRDNAKIVFSSKWATNTIFLGNL